MNRAEQCHVVSWNLQLFSRIDELVYVLIAAQSSLNWSAWIRDSTIDIIFIKWDLKSETREIYVIDVAYFHCFYDCFHRCDSVLTTWSEYIEFEIKFQSCWDWCSCLVHKELESQILLIIWVASINFESLWAEIEERRIYLRAVIE